jgi:uncharacterized protein YcbX
MAYLSLIQHYLEYLRSPPVLLTILVIVGPFLLEVFKNRILPTGPAKYGIAGCFRLGLTKRSNLHDQDIPEVNIPASTNSQSSDSTKPKIKALFTYPIKSCRGVELAASEIGATGLKYDRVFTFAQSKSSDSSSADNAPNGEKREWQFITQREFPRLALLQTELWVPDPRKEKKSHTNGKATNQDAPAAENEKRDDIEDWAANGGCVILRFEYKPDFNPLGLRTEIITIKLPLTPTIARAKSRAYGSEELNIWKDCLSAINMSNEIAADDLIKLKSSLGVKNNLAIFRVDDSNRRAVTRSLPKDRSDEHFKVGFADAFPMHILSIASIQSVYAQQPDKEKRKYLDARRFRANIYLTDTPAFDEDSWKRITVGRCLKLPANPTRKFKQAQETNGEYHIACRTARCKLPNVHPETGVKDNNEPYTTLARTRQVDEGAKPHPCLGMQMIPLFQQGILRVGDEVEVLERGEHVYEKMFA